VTKEFRECWAWATISITITNNTSTGVNGWDFVFDFPGDQTITNFWNGTYIQNGTDVSVHDAGFNATISANGGSVNFGFNLNYSGTNVKPAAFTLNGTPCYTGWPAPTTRRIATPTPTRRWIPTATPTPRHLA
jgi:hypothetical protein